MKKFRIIKDITPKHLKNLGFMEDQTEFARFNRRPFIFDDFTVANNEWGAAGAWVINSSIAFENGRLKLNAGSYSTSCYANRNAIGKNCIQKVKMTTNYSGQIQSRVSASNAFGTAYISPSTGYLSFLLQGSSGLTLPNKLVPDFDNAKEYELRTISYENRFGVTAFLDGIVQQTCSLTESYFGGLSGLINGISASSNQITYFDNYEFRNITDNDFINVICLGDSQTAGNQVGTGNAYQRLFMNKYQDKPVDFVNKGVSGNTTQQVIDRLATDVYAHYIPGVKNIVILMIGINDITAGTSTSTIISNINTIMDGCIANGFEVWLNTIPPKNDAGVSINPNVRIVNASLRQSTKPKVLIDLYSEFVNPANDNLPLPQYVIDQVHLSPLAHTIWFNKLDEYFKNLFAKARGSFAEFDCFLGKVNPLTLADADAPNNTLYYSSTSSKLVYKDSNGVVNALY